VVWAHIHWWRAVAVLQKSFSYGLLKKTNSVIDADGRVRRRFLDILAHRTVVVCGVTTTSCIKAAVEDLAGRCAKVLVAADAVAGVATATKRCAMLLEKWKSMAPGGAVDVIDSWRDALPERVHAGAPDVPTAARESAGVPRRLVPHALREAAARMVYYVNGSIPSWRVFMALYHSGVSFEAVRMFVMSRPRPTRTDAFYAMNPRGQTPVLLEGAALVEHGAIPGRVPRVKPGETAATVEAGAEAEAEAEVVERMEEGAAIAALGAPANVRESLAILTYLQRFTPGLEWLIPASVSCGEQFGWACVRFARKGGGGAVVGSFVWVLSCLMAGVSTHCTGARSCTCACAGPGERASAPHVGRHRRLVRRPRCCCFYVGWCAACVCARPRDTCPIHC